MLSIGDSTQGAFPRHGVVEEVLNGFAHNGKAEASNRRLILKGGGDQNGRKNESGKGDRDYCRVS